MELRAVQLSELDVAMTIIDGAKVHLRKQGIDQWQNGYPDQASISSDILSGKGFFVVDSGAILGYLCIDFDGEPAYETLQGTWATGKPYVVVHRMALADAARGKGISSTVFQLVEEVSLAKGVEFFRIDTDAANAKMQHILRKNGFTYRGTILFDNSEKIAFDKTIGENGTDGP